MSKENVMALKVIMNIYEYKGNLFSTISSRLPKTIL